LVTGIKQQGAFEPIAADAKPRKTLLEVAVYLLLRKPVIGEKGKKNLSARIKGGREQTSRLGTRLGGSLPHEVRMR